jgi:hypothetical protein
LTRDTKPLCEHAPTGCSTGHYDLLGHRNIILGDPIDWWLDPVAGCSRTDRHWSEIDFLNPASVGDHKLVWELGRHSALVTLGQAWWCTRDHRYADECLRLLESWLDTNPPKQGVHWASSLETCFPRHRVALGSWHWWTTSCRRNCVAA